MDTLRRSALPTVVLLVLLVQTANAGVATTFVGERPWAVLLCRFADEPDVPHAPAYYEDLFGVGVGDVDLDGASGPDLVDYWHDVSYGHMTLEGTEVFGWFDLPLPRADYLESPDPGRPNRTKLSRHCQRAAVPAVDFSQYEGVAHFFSGWILREGFGGPAFLQVGDEDRSVPSIVMSDPSTWPHPGWRDHPQGVIAHEMGHGFLFDHTSSSPEYEYGSPYDVMSDIGPGCMTPEPCLPVHPVAMWARQAGWISELETVVPPAGSSSVVDLLPLSIPGDGDGQTRLIEIPVRGSAVRGLTVEARVRSGRDAEVLYEGVLIHYVDNSGFEPYDQRTVMDADADGDARDEEAIWTPGETFVHAPSGIEVTVLSVNDDGSFRVRVTTPEKEIRRYRRRISIDLSHDLSAVSQVTTRMGPPECLMNVPVWLQRKTPDGWKDVKRYTVDATGYGGAFVSTPPRGWYRAVARRVVAGWDVCRRAVSPSAWYGGP